MSPPTLNECRAVVCERLSIHWKVLVAVRLGWSIPPPRLVIDELPPTKPPAKANCGMFPRPKGELAAHPVLKPKVSACGPVSVASKIFERVNPNRASFRVLGLITRVYD